MSPAVTHPRIDLADLTDDQASPVLRTFIDLAAIPSPPRDEGRVSTWCRGYLEGLGLEVREDDAATTIPGGGAGTGNLFARLPGTVPGTPIFLCAHLDTVPLEDDVVPVIEDRDGVLVVTNENEAILGGDNKAAVAVMLELVRELVQSGDAHAGLEIVLTPCEEIGLLGAKAVDVSTLVAEYGYVFDHANDIGKIVVEAPTQVSITATFTGLASHSGIAPEEGRSAIRAAADAIAAMPHGRIDARTTANVGLISGGTAVNIVAEECVLHAEVRGLDHERCAEVTEDVLAAFADAATRHSVDLDVSRRDEYLAYGFKESSRPVAHAARALAAAGYEPSYVPCGGGSDANVFNVAGKPCVNLPNGMRLIHTRDEYVEVRDLTGMLDVARQLVALARD
ncbi:MAG: peptidase dimerization domain protein [Thermoleophilia bacterium]|nr:peptidase dimerization domain protein [Thermoleophilia bacterium]MCZ4495628.1 peptidase dimerization domain protein [Thermoleophilia bacterium]